MKKLMKRFSVYFSLVTAIITLSACTNEPTDNTGQPSPSVVPTVNPNLTYTPPDTYILPVVQKYETPDNAVQYFVDIKNGSDENDGSIEKPFKSIEKARDTVRPLLENMSSDIVINLREGTYYLTSAFELEPEDSGRNGYSVVYRSHNNEKVVISGGKTVENWSLHDTEKNIWKASANGINTRNFSVNGILAQRARSERKFISKLFQSNQLKPGEVLELIADSQTADGGFTSSDLEWTKLKRQSKIEFVGMRTFNVFRMPIESITEVDGRAYFKISPEAWRLFNDTKEVAYGKDTLLVDTLYCFENAYEFMDEKGEWYLDTDADTIYYIPQDGEDMATANAVLGELEQLIIANGTEDNKVTNLRFEGITFSNTKWMQANAPEGLMGIQGGYYRSAETTTATQWTMDRTWIRPSASLIFNYTDSIKIVNCNFINLGSYAVDFSRNTTNAVITGNRFSECGGGGIIIGGFMTNDHFPKNASRDKFITKDNYINDNYIDNICKENASECGILRGYTFNTQIAHNTMTNLPYSGISTGWGWGSNELNADKVIDRLFPEGMFSGNTIINNRLDNTLSLIEDGGAIYCLGRQDGQKIMGNYITNCREFAIYLDNGSAGSLVRDNVVKDNHRGFKLNLGYDCTFINNWQENLKLDHILAPIDSKHTFTYDPTQPTEELRDSVINTCGVRAPFKSDIG